MLNIDWFQPCKFSPDIVRDVYLSIMNLPRKLRFKPENIILVGILPGTHEPFADGLVHYIQPLVNELLDLLDRGLKVHPEGQAEALTMKAALLCIASDLPTAKKLCGFLGHAAKLG